MRSLLAACLVAVYMVAPAALANDDLTWSATLAELDKASTPTEAPAGSWLASTEKAAAEAEVDAKAEIAAPPAGDGPPLPVHTIEGVGGALTVPMAYLVNPGPEGTIIGKPAASFTYLGLGTKNVQVMAVTQTFVRRNELGYAISRFDTGNMGSAITKAGKKLGLRLKLHHRDVWLHHFNIRGLLVEENTKILGIPMPAIVAGIQAKYNATVQDIRDHLETPFGELPEMAGLDKSNGIDYVLTISKMFPTLLFGRPLILTAGLRNSKAAAFGYLGFGKSCATTLEFDVATLLTDWLAVGYEFRQRVDPYDLSPPVNQGEENLHAIRAAVILSDQLTLAAGWAYLGHVGNADVDCAWGIQVKYEF